MNELVMLIQTSQKLDNVADMLAFIAKDLKTSLDANNATLVSIQQELSNLRNELNKSTTLKTKLK